MNRIRFLLLLLLLLSCAGLFAQEQDSINPNGYNVFYYPNGKVSSEGPMRDGKPDGYWKTYNEAGMLVSEGNRKNFELDSTWRFFDNEGKKRYYVTPRGIIKVCSLFT